MSLINRSNDKQQEVPRVEIQGEDIVIDRPDRKPDERPEEHKIPKTKWWC